MVDPRQLDAAVLANAMGIKTLEDSTSVYDDMIPEYARVQVPLKSKGSIDDCADILIALGHSIRLLARRHDLMQSHALHLVHLEVKTANARMQGSTKYGEQK